MNLNGVSNERNLNEINFHKHFSWDSTLGMVNNGDYFFTLLSCRRCYLFLHRVLLLLKQVGNARLRESDAHPISPKTPAPQYHPLDRKKRKGKRAEDYSMDRAA